MTPTTVIDTNPGPIAQLRYARQSPVALTIGAAMGGAAPIVNYVTVHWGHLAWFDGKTVLFACWDNPLWLLVAGSFALSVKSVYQWGLNAFGDRMKAAGLVAMLEGALLVAPHPWLGYAALTFLTLMNAAASGASIALRDRVDRARETSAATCQPSGETACHAEQLAPRVPTPARPKPAALFPDLYTRAIEVARGNDNLSTEVLRRALSCRQPTAAALIRQLEVDGVIGQADRANHGRRPVLLRAET